MTTNHETVGGVLADTRERITKHPGCTYTSGAVLFILDRIERAHARESDNSFSAGDIASAQGQGYRDAVAHAAGAGRVPADTSCSAPGYSSATSTQGSAQRLRPRPIRSRRPRPMRGRLRISRAQGLNGSAGRWRRTTRPARPWRTVGQSLRRTRSPA